MTPDEANQFVIDAVIYALENRDPGMDYGRYVSADFINTIDDKRFDFEQWVQHLKSIKSVVRSMKPTFDCVVSDGKNVFASYYVKSVKNDGGEIIVKDLAHFVVEDRQVIFCDELTKLIQGGDEDQNFASMS